MPDAPEAFEIERLDMPLATFESHSRDLGDQSRNALNLFRLLVSVHLR